MQNTIFKNESNQWGKRVLFLLLLIFTVCSLKLCAEDITPAQAQVEREKFVAEAKKYVGCPYVLGAVGPDSFDCSGLIYYVARESVGIQLPRTAKAIYSYCRIVPDKSREVGDLVFFKTNSTGNISHVGIYIGNGQFISAISDGENTGVIISSLNQTYWKGKYVATGQFMKSGTGTEEQVEAAIAQDAKEKEKHPRQVHASRSGNDLTRNIIFDASTNIGWSLIAPNSFMFRFRAFDIQINARYKKWFLEPGFAIGARINFSQDVFQIPLLFTATMSEYVRLYAGPVISFTNAHLVTTDKTISASVFPGTIGVVFSTPSFSIKEAKVQFVQDISYSVFNNTDNAALNFLESLSAGLVMFTGVRVSLPLSTFVR